MKKGSSLFPTIGPIKSNEMAGNIYYSDKKFLNISASSWVIYDLKGNSILHGRREYQKREIASLTKIMTCWVVINICREYGINPKVTYVLVSEVAASVRGTTANLRTGDILTVDQLLYGLMLPSGNDAAFALA